MFEQHLDGIARTASARSMAVDAGQREQPAAAGRMQGAHHRTSGAQSQAIRDVFSTLQSGHHATIVDQCDCPPRTANTAHRLRLLPAALPAAYSTDIRHRQPSPGLTKASLTPDPHTILIGLFDTAGNLPLSSIARL